MSAIKSTVLIPLATFLLLLGGGIITGFYWMEQSENTARMRQAVDGVQDAFQRLTSDDANLMQATSSAIQRIEPIRDALASRDRDRLQTLSKDLFQELKANHRITHFYFHQPDRVNLLRLHQPSRYGDLIPRHTARTAQESGHVSSGLETGPLGTFTLRTVTPWFVGSELIGFIELGEEIDHFITHIRRMFPLDIYVFVPKRGLNREDWETGMRMLGRPAAWDSFQDVVLVEKTTVGTPPILSDFAGGDGGGDGGARLNVPMDGGYFNIARLPIMDVAGQEKAFMIIFQDVTAQTYNSRRLAIFVILTCVLGGGGLILLFLHLLDRLENKLKRAEKQESRLGRILDASLNEIFIFDAETLRFQEANHGALRSLGYDLFEVRDLTPMHLFTEYNAGRFNTLLAPLREGSSELIVFETAARRKDDTFYPVDVHLQLFGDEQPPVFVAIVQDITERKRQEEAILESEARLSSIASSAQDAIVMIDDTGRITYWNKSASRIFGHTPEEAYGHDMHRLLAPGRFLEAAIRGVEIFRNSGEGNILNQTVELVGLRKSGEEFPFELSTSAFILRGHWCAIGILRDITKRKELENRMKLGSSVIEHAMEGIIVTDSRGDIQLVNPSFCQLTGYGVSEVVGRNPSMLQSGRHDDSFYRKMWHTLTETSVWQGEIWNRRKSGEVYPEWLSISAIKDEQGSVSNYVGIFSDITQRKEFENYMENLAFYDALTAIPNRMLFNERLVQAVKEATRNQQKLAVFYLDLDFFKEVNDSHGHKVGDLLLQEVAQRLKALLRQEDTVARLGGDEFAIILRVVQPPTDTTLVAGKIIEVLSKPFLLQGHECRIGTSIGISLFPTHAADGETLVKLADSAMYLSKKGGRNRYTYYGTSTA